MKKLTVKEILQHGAKVNDEIMVQGWVRGKRGSKRVAFIILQDGTHQVPLQVVVGSENYPKNFSEITVGTSVLIQGKVVASRGGGQKVELQANQVSLLGKADAREYPLQPKHHSMEFLRSIQHLRFRTNTFRAIFNIRHKLSYGIHDFFNHKGFVYVHTPIITSLDAEGAGELFGLHTGEKVDTTCFFDKPVYLTVSGQLAGEAAALGLGKVYTFGPTFRAENSNTGRHLSEFWMVEPEISFCDLPQCIDLAEELLKWIANYLLKESKEELSFLAKKHEKESSSPINLWDRLEQLASQPLVRISYDEAFHLLNDVSAKSGHKFTYPLSVWGADLQKEHEDYLVMHFGRGVVVHDYPKDKRPFYMRKNKDGKTVANMDILLPGVGEVVGGSQREERYEELVNAIKKKKMDISSLAWYLDTRRYGSIVHSGFGLGLDRLVQFTTGVHNIRDTILFPRTPGNALC